MKRIARAAALSALAFALMAGAASAATDKLTGLPLYPGAPFTMDLPPYDFCGSKYTGTMYQPNGQVSVLLAWYKAHLPGYHYYHGFDGRTQDMLSKPDGTLVVNLTGEPDKSGKIYGISYGKFSKPMSQATLESMNSHNIVCK